MNTIIQNILAFSAVATAVVFLVKKFFWKKPEKACGSKDGCGCH